MSRRIQEPPVVGTVFGLWTVIGSSSQKELGMSKSTFHMRVRKLGWSDEKALTTPRLK